MSDLVDVNWIQLEVGMAVYDLAIEKTLADYGPPDAIVKIDGDELTLSNGHCITWQGPGYCVPVAAAKGLE